MGYGADPQTDWLAARHIQRHLNTMSEYQGEKKGAIAVFFSVLGKAKCEDNANIPIHVLVAASDAEGVAVSGFGFQSIIGCNVHASPEVWLQGDHPMLSQPRWPERPMGAMVVKQAPHHLVGLCDGEDFSLAGAQYAEWLRRVRSSRMKPWLNGDFAGMDPRVSLDALRDVVQSASHRGLDLHPFWLGLGQKDPIVCADLAVGPKAVAHPAAIESATVVIEVLEQVVAPSGLYMRLLQLSPASSEALTVLAATRHPTQPDMTRSIRGARTNHLETHADTPVYEQSCRRACLLGCDGAIAEQVFAHTCLLFCVLYTPRGGI